MRLERVWKAYPDWSGSPSTLRAMISTRRRRATRGGQGRRWALRDVAVELEQGQSLALVGHNGAGKSTLLRLLSGIGRPTRGTVAIDRDTASVLNLGAAFDFELTGAENAYTSALVAGFSRGQARAMVPEILEFSELGDYVDAPVRTYSEGMKLRLAFSSVAVVRPRLLVLDEVLAVGDGSFRAKCAARIAELQEAGTSVVLASHSMEEVVRTCERAMWLQHGSVRAIGDAATVVGEYERAVHEDAIASTPVGGGRDSSGLQLGENRFGTQEATIEGVRFGTPPTQRARIRSGGRLDIELELRAANTITDPVVAVSIRRPGDETPLIDLTTPDAGFELGRVHTTTLALRIERLDLCAGDYKLDVGVYRREWETTYDVHRAAYDVRVDGPSGGKGLLAAPCRWERLS